MPDAPYRPDTSGFLAATQGGRRVHQRAWPEQDGGRATTTTAGYWVITSCVALGARKHDQMIDRFRLHD